MASLPPGTLFSKGRYQLVREINRGGTAVVYEALDRQTGQAVALKVLHVRNGKLAVPVKAVQREIELAAGLRSCPYVVQLLDYFAEDEQQAVIVWELVQGPDMLDLLNEHGGRMHEATAAHYFSQLVRGVQYLHDRGLCHRDIKPENVLVERSTNRIRIIDFGLSKRQSSAVTLGVGTCDYCCPELINGGDIRVFKERTTGSYDATKVDCWALGVLLYLLVIGRYPFEDPAHPQNVVVTLRNIAAGAYRPIPAHVSPACADLIRRMLVLDPSARIPLRDILAHPWLAAHTRLPAEAAEPAAEAAAAVAAAADAAAEPEGSSSQMEEDGAACSGTGVLGGGAGAAAQEEAAAAVRLLLQVQQRLQGAAAAGGAGDDAAAVEAMEADVPAGSAAYAAAAASSAEAGQGPMEVEQDQERDLEHAVEREGKLQHQESAAALQMGERTTSETEFYELPVSIAACPSSRSATFSFPHPAGARGSAAAADCAHLVESKATPATPRIIHLTAASAQAAAAAAGVVPKAPLAPAMLGAAAPAQQAPPSRRQASSTAVAAAPAPAAAASGSQQAGAKRQRASPSFFCSFFGAGLFGSGGSCPRTSSCQE